ncbi:MAG: HAD-IIIA family hydrolase [Synergistaceae bacterium]|jgi:3-deoxy-D-manno-octulosonate 8-phosphate phosphatase (KDO 8-P phosphatase)|nr:HAD-IIIA family hydrolase [Synergistaceae bacterium]
MIRLVAMDVDGTLTDGGIYMDGAGEFKKFYVQDGYGIVSLIRSGVEIAFISGRHSPATDARAGDLGVKHVYNGTKDKLSDLKSLADKIGVSQSEVCFIGDDVPDIPCIEWAGLGVAVGDAVGEVKSSADMTTESPGGRGAVREAADRILSMNGDSTPI